MTRGAGGGHNGQAQTSNTRQQGPMPPANQQQQQQRQANYSQQQQQQQQQRYPGVPDSQAAATAAAASDYSSRLAPSYAGWQGTSSQPPNQQGGYQAQMFSGVPSVGYDAQAAAGLAAVAAAQHSLTPARPPQPNTRPERYMTDAAAMPPPGGQPSGGQGGPYVPRLDIPYPGAPPVHGGWSGQDQRQSVSPTTTMGEQRANGGGSRPGTSDGSGSLLSPVQVKEERRDGGGGENESKPDEQTEKVDHRKRKRNRTIRSCVPCHNHKRKCDRRRPCGRCTALGLTGSCVYEVDEARDPNDPEVIETDRLRRRIAELEQVVRELRQRHPPRNQAQAQAASNTTTNNGTSSQNSSSATPATADDKRRVIVDRFAKFKLGEAAAGMGWSVTSASEGSPESNVSRRDHYAEPYSAASLPGEDLVADKLGTKTFLGAPAGKPMFRRLREIVQGKGKDQSEIVVPEDLAFTGWFSTRKTYPFTTIWSHDNFMDEIIGLLPGPEDADMLFDAFVNEISVLFEPWAPHDFAVGYRRFFSLPMQEKRAQPLQELSLYIMVCSLGCMVRSSASEIFGDDRMAHETPPKERHGDSKDHTTSRLQSELYLSAAYQALRLCSFLSSPTIHTIQSQVLICVYLLHSERAADSWALTGSLVRQCIAMGLHVDPAHLDPRISMKEAEIKRRVWWTVAGLDALLCVSFGRPSVINYYTCGLPQDWPDDALSDEPGSAVAQAPPNNALGPETNDQTYHAAYYQITLPSLEMLNRVFYVSPLVARDTFMGWFQPAVADQPVPLPTVVGNTYEDAIRLGRDIFDWYSHVPEGMRFDPDDKDLVSLRTRTRMRINQTLALVVKTFILVLILHRPYLRADPSAYPESSQLCGRSAHIILRAYSAMARTNSSIVWSWWTMSYRAFHAGTVCAFLAIREPGTELAERCLADLHAAIKIFDDRSSNWNVTHPVQGDLSAGLHRLEKLATVATQQQQQQQQHHQQQQHQTSPRQDQHRGFSPVIFPNFGMDPSVPAFPAELTQAAEGGHDILGFPTALGVHGHHTPGREHDAHAGGDHDGDRPAPFLQPWNLGHNDQGIQYTNEPLALPQIWASMFNIKMDPEIAGLTSGVDEPGHMHGSGGGHHTATSAAQ